MFFDIIIHIGFEFIYIIEWLDFDTIYQYELPFLVNTFQQWYLYYYIRLFFFI